MLTRERLIRACERVTTLLFQEAAPQGFWVGELSSSPLSTATAVVAMLKLVASKPELSDELKPLIARGLEWLLVHPNADGGWGDTIQSPSNISTTALCYAALHLAEQSGHKPTADGTDFETKRWSQLKEAAWSYFEQHGGFDAIRGRYGSDHTFSVPILTQCALAGLIDWREITPLPFELGVFPHWCYKFARLPVVSYALPALIAIGQVRHFFAPSPYPWIRLVRRAAVKPTLKRLIALQPDSGGFLEATPLTSFVTMSLAAMGLADHPVAQRGLQFLKDSIRPDGSWPIDTNLTTWVTTLSVNALPRLSEPQRNAVVSWLLAQQHRRVHPYTNAAPGGWAWTDLTGGVPDADDTPGAILALLKLAPDDPSVREALEAAVGWLLDLQNSDGGWPTFCRGWGTLPFDRSSPDLTAHAVRALFLWNQVVPETDSNRNGKRRLPQAIERGFQFLARRQRTDGTWLPLWFGNPHTADEENPVYGTARVLAAYRDCQRWESPQVSKAVGWLVAAQNPDGSWGGSTQTPSSVEETSLAVEVLVQEPQYKTSCQRGLEWLLSRVEADTVCLTAPIGLYFAKLWYFERLYPIIFAAGALQRAVEQADKLIP